MVCDNAKQVISEALNKNGFMFQKEIKDMNNEVIGEVWRNRKGKDYFIYINELDLEYKVVIKSTNDDTGFIVDVELNNNIIATEVYYYDDLEEQYREYLIELSNNEEADIRQILSWEEWLFQKKELIREATKEDLGDLE